MAASTNTTTRPGPDPSGPGREPIPPTKTGTVPFTLPGFGDAAETAYKIWGSLDGGSGSGEPVVPLIVLHGGPGVPSNYLGRISLLYEDFRIPVVMYDQVGCGASTRFPQYAGRTDVWTPALFVAELDNLRKELGIEKFNLLGQSWGGMLAMEYLLAGKAAGINKLVVSNSPASMALWGKAAAILRAGLPADVQAALDKNEADGTTDSKEYEAAVQVFYDRHLCRVSPVPVELVESFGMLAEDATVYGTMNGPSEFHVVGSLKTWTVEDQLHRVDSKMVPGGVLLVNGYYDEAQDSVVRPYFERIQARIKWRTFGLSSHTPWVEEPEEFKTEIAAFLTEK